MLGPLPPRMDPTPETGPIRRKTVLCIDDEQMIRDVLALHLRRRAYDVETAADGLSAWQLVMNDLNRFDVIITDNQMPQLDGVGLVERLRGVGFRGKILFFSSTLAAHHMERVNGLVDEIVEKGRPVSDLIMTLESMVNGS